MSMALTNPEATNPLTSIQKVTAFKNAYLRSPLLAQVEKDLERLFDYGQVGAQSGTSANTYMLVGAPGSGKTGALRRFENRHPKVQEAERDVYPVLYVEVPPCTTRKALAERILQALRAFVPANSTESRLTEKVRKHLRDQGVKVLVLDEAQHLTNPDRRRLNYEAADWVKGIANDGTCSVVLAGVLEAWEVYRYNGQLRRRSFGNRTLTAFRVSERGGLHAFRGLLDKFEEILPFDERSNLKDDLTALRIHRQVGGLIGRLSDFLAAALVLALEEGLRCLTPDVLREVAIQQCPLDNPDWQNPFDMNRNELMAAAVEEEGRPSVIGIDLPTNLRRGPRLMTQRDVLA